MIETLANLASLVTAAVAFYIFLYSKKQQRFLILEQSFDVLQRINEKALESDLNACAAVQSANPQDKMSAPDARILYFHYMRINRIFRVFEYYQGGFILWPEAERIITPQVKTLVSVKNKLPFILERGYPPEFATFLMQRVELSSLPSIIGSLNDISDDI